MKNSKASRKAVLLRKTSVKKSYRKIVNQTFDTLSSVKDVEQIDLDSKIKRIKRKNGRKFLIFLWDNILRRKKIRLRAILILTITTILENVL